MEDRWREKYYDKVEELRLAEEDLDKACQLMRKLIEVHSMRNEHNLINTSPEEAKRAWDAVKEFVGIID